MCLNIICLNIFPGTVSPPLRFSFRIGFHDWLTMKHFWRSEGQRCACSSQYSTVHLKIVTRVDLLWCVFQNWLGHLVTSAPQIWGLHLSPAGCCSPSQFSTSSRSGSQGSPQRSRFQLSPWKDLCPSCPRREWLIGSYHLTSGKGTFLQPGQRCAMVPCPGNRGLCGQCQFWYLGVPSVRVPLSITQAHLPRCASQWSRGPHLPFRVSSPEHTEVWSAGDIVEKKEQRKDLDPLWDIFGRSGHHAGSQSPAGILRKPPTPERDAPRGPRH